MHAIPMSIVPYPTTLDFYRSADCEPCSEARAFLQQVLEDRARRGEQTPRVRYVDIDSDPELRRTFGALVPVIALGGQQLPLVTSYRQIDFFIDRVLGRRA
jgi:glutaredoxin